MSRSSGLLPNAHSFTNEQGSDLAFLPDERNYVYDVPVDGGLLQKIHKIHDLYEPSSANRSNPARGPHAAAPPQQSHVAAYAAPAFPRCRSL
jgi:hypothetical protein